MEQLRRLGWLPDIPGHRDYTSDHPAVAPLLKRIKFARQLIASARDELVAVEPGLPATVDLRPSFSPVEDQGRIGTCTAQAAVGLLEYQVPPAWRSKFGGIAATRAARRRRGNNLPTGYGYHKEGKSVDKPRRP
jgi:hypothetical protein